MAAYLMVQVHMRDDRWVQDYIANVPAIVRAYGGDYFAVSEALTQFEGDSPAPDQAAILSFPSLDAIGKFMQSEEYRPWKEARLKQSSATIIGFET